MRKYELLYGTEHFVFRIFRMLWTDGVEISEIYYFDNQF